MKRKKRGNKAERNARKNGRQKARSKVSGRRRR